MIVPPSSKPVRVNTDPLYWKAYLSLMERAAKYRQDYPIKTHSIADLVAINKLSDHDSLNFLENLK